MTVDRSKASECGTKQQHPTRQAAREHLWSLERRGAAGWRMSVYKCQHCGAWHVGHRPKPKGSRR